MVIISSLRLSLVETGERPTRTIHQHRSPSQPHHQGAESQHKRLSTKKASQHQFVNISPGDLTEEATTSEV